MNDETAETPTVSVVIPTYNRAEFLEDAIGSVLDGNYTDLECVVVDGGSTDGTRELLDAIRDDRLRVITRDRPRGVSNARNVGVEAADGEYVVFLDDDDRLYEGAIEVLLETLRDSPPDCAGVYTAGRYVDESGTRRIRRASGRRVKRYEDSDIGGPSCTILRAEVFDEVGTFDESLPSAEDVDFWIRLFSSYDMVALDRVLYDRRLHDDQMISDRELLIEGNRKVLEKHGADLSAHQRAGRHYEIAHYFAGLDRPASARTHLRAAVRSRPRGLAYHYYHFWLLFGSVGYACGRGAHRRIYRPVVDRLRSVHR